MKGATIQLTGDLKHENAQRQPLFFACFYIGEPRPIDPAISPFLDFFPRAPGFSTDFDNQAAGFWPPAESSAASGMACDPLMPLHASHASRFFLKDSLSDSKSEEYFTAGLSRETAQRR